MTVWIIEDQKDDMKNAKAATLSSVPGAEIVQIENFEMPGAGKRSPDIVVLDLFVSENSELKLKGETVYKAILDRTKSSFFVIWSDYIETDEGYRFVKDVTTGSARNDRVVVEETKTRPRLQETLLQVLDRIKEEESAIAGR